MGEQGSTINVSYADIVRIKILHKYDPFELKTALITFEIERHQPNICS
jgi:hypothetical protein